MSTPCTTFAAAFALLASLCLATSVHAGGKHAGGHGGSPIGEPGTTDKVTRTVDVEASDTMRFTPSSIAVKQGETLRIRVKNVGQLKHEFSLGTEKELKEHYEVMKKFPDMVHDEPGKVSLQPGEQGEVIWRFSQAGAVHFACLHPGHYDAGMKGKVQVTRK